MICGDHPYRVVVIVLLFITWSIIITDFIFNPILWTKLLFYILTQALMVFRLLGRSFVTIIIHAMATIGILSALYLHYYLDYGVPDTEYYTDEVESLGYNLESILIKKQSDRRTAFKMFWLTYPVGIMIAVSLTGIFCILGLPLNLRRIFAALHSTMGLSIVMIYFLVGVFYTYYFKNFNDIVILKMFYYLAFLIVLLTPNLINRNQILSKYYTDEDEEEEEDEGEEEQAYELVEGVK